MFRPNEKRPHETYFSPSSKRLPLKSQMETHLAAEKLDEVRREMLAQRLELQDPISHEIFCRASSKEQNATRLLSLYTDAYNHAHSWSLESRPSKESIGTLRDLIDAQTDPALKRMLEHTFAHHLRRFVPRE